MVRRNSKRRSGKASLKAKRKSTPKAKGPKAAPAPVAADETPPSEGARFPVVGIGASAGGLEAMERFLKHLPQRTGMAFVFVQHLDPTHKGMLVKLLQRATPMPVLQVEDRLPIEPDHLYVIPPNKDMSLLHGILHLLPQTSPRGMPLPIDFFLRSLAADQQERSIGVILSGMGSDGALGLRSIKEKGGASFVQSLGSAKFDGMPRSAIDAGLADVVAPVDELPSRIIAFQKHAPFVRQPGAVLEGKAASSLEKVFILLRAQTGNDFSQYKRSTLYRRIERRMGLHQIDNVERYVRFLRENAPEIELLFKELLIGVTSFFRDPPAWDHLKNEVLPMLLASRTTGGVLRAWVPGCSTGEEAYSLAIVFSEAMEPFKPVKNLVLQVFATDLDKDAVEKARLGLYPDNIAADVSADRVRRYFVKENVGYRVAKEIREMVVFAPQNIIMDPPFTKVDILSCRNLLIYLSPELQKKLIPLFHYSLNPGGVLFLGSAETIGPFSSLFAPLDGKSRTYRRLDQSVVAVPVDFTARHLPQPMVSGTEGPEVAPSPRTAPPNIQILADRVLIQRFAPVGVLCNDKGDILYISGRSSKYLEPAVGKANLNLFAMAREDLRYEVSSAFSAALREPRTVTVRGIKLGANGGTQVIDLIVQKLTEPKELRGTVMVVFVDVPKTSDVQRRPRPRTESHRIAELDEEIRRAREEVQSTREQMQGSQEELKSSNEELQSTNEELQSTNEELTTSKEEMQSLNEELQTVNHELQSKVDELSHSNNDMKNLLNSTDIATLFLDRDLRVRRFTPPTTTIIKLIPGDAGRPITDIAWEIDYPELADDAREVLRTLVVKESERSSRDGRWFVVRILPYRTLENVIDGLVMTFTDISAAHSAEASLREQAGQLRQLTESLPTLVWGCRADGSCDYVSRQWVDYTGIPSTEELGYGWLERTHPEDRERVREAWRDAAKSGDQLDVEFRIRRADGSYRWFKTRAAPIRDPHGSVLKWYATSTDVDDLKHADEERAVIRGRFESILQGIREGFVALDRDLIVLSLNRAAERLLSRGRGDVVGKKFQEAFPELVGAAVFAKLDEARRTKASLEVEVHLEDARNAGNYRLRIDAETSKEVLLLIERDGLGALRG